MGGLIRCGPPVSLPRVRGDACLLPVSLLLRRAYSARS